MVKKYTAETKFAKNFSLFNSDLVIFFRAHIFNVLMIHGLAQDLQQIVNFRFEPVPPRIVPKRKDQTQTQNNATRFDCIPLGIVHYLFHAEVMYRILAVPKPSDRRSSKAHTVNHLLTNSQPSKVIVPIRLLVLLRHGSPRMMQLYRTLLMTMRMYL